LPLDRFNFRQAVFSRHTRGSEKFAHHPVRKPVDHMQAFLVRFDQAGGPQGLQVLRGVCQTHTGFPGQGFDAFGTLAEQIQHFQSLRTGNGAADSGELFIDGVLELPAWTIIARPFN
jgi:hypothetical protein